MWMINLNMAFDSAVLSNGIGDVSSSTQNKWVQKW